MIQTETTPNPNSLKFLSEKVISAIGTEEFQRERSKDLKNKFVKELLEFKGVELVLLSKNFLSVKKTDDVSWNELKPMVISHLNHYFEKNDTPILKENTKSNINKEENNEIDNNTMNNEENQQQDEDEDDSLNVSLAAMEEKLKPKVLNDFNDITKLFKKLQKHSLELINSDKKMKRIILF